MKPRWKIGIATGNRKSGSVLAVAHRQRARDPQHLVELAWHIGNRHLPAQICEARILLRRDRIIRAMLEQLGAAVGDVTEPFTPAHGAYHAHEH